MAATISGTALLWLLVHRVTVDAIQAEPYKPIIQPFSSGGWKPVMDNQAESRAARPEMENPGAARPVTDNQVEPRAVRPGIENPVSAKPVMDNQAEPRAARPGMENPTASRAAKPNGMHSAAATYMEAVNITRADSGRRKIVVQHSAPEVIQAVLNKLNSVHVPLMYETPDRHQAPSTLYQWGDMIKAVNVMAETGIGKTRLWLGDTKEEVTFGLVSIAAFLAQAMHETIRYDACDENNWSDMFTAAKIGGAVYSAASACGQLGQSYQDYTCTAEDDHEAGGHMACDVDPKMEQRAFTGAGWYAAPRRLFCAPRSKVPKAPRWNIDEPWCPPDGQDGHKDMTLNGDVDLNTYFEYVKNGGSCQDVDTSGGWDFEGEGCSDGACPNAEAPNFHRAARTDVEGCCWWGRGVIQTTGVCNFGKLNFYLGKRAAKRGVKALYPQIDFCTNPGAVCDPKSPKELKWIAGLFYWMNSVQGYEEKGWSFMEKLKNFATTGFTDDSFIDGVSGIVNRGCPLADCGTGAIDGQYERRENFRKVLIAMGFHSSWR